MADWRCSPSVHSQAGRSPLGDSQVQTSMSGHSNGKTTITSAEEVSALFDAVKPLITSFIRASETSSAARGPKQSSQDGGSAQPNGLSTDPVERKVVEIHPPKTLEKLMAKALDIPEHGLGKEGIMGVVEEVLKYSANTWDQGFMDKLYASTNAIGVVSEMILAVLNTNVHVYQVSPALTLIERTVAKRLAGMFGLGPASGGVTQPGGSASNASSIIIARNHLFPETKKGGLGGRRFVLFTSKHGHYSLEKAAQMFGFGSDAVVPVPVDAEGRMIPSELDRLVSESKAKGDTPFYVNATAGTTVLGSFDPFDDISAVCKKHNLWMHVDGSWGGSVVFNRDLARQWLKGAEKADSIAVNPHKMLAVPMTCSFLLVRDLSWAWQAMTLPAGYLFHSESSSDIYDLADLTPQCGRRGDALKLFLSWSYYGSAGLSDLVATAYARAGHLLNLVKVSPNLVIASPEPLPCLQVCFYYAPEGSSAAGDDDSVAQRNSSRTRTIADGLITRGFMVDYAPGPAGEFLRVVVHANKEKRTLETLVSAVEELGAEAVRQEAA